MRLAWFGSALFASVIFQATLWAYAARRNEPQGELLWPAFLLSIGAIILQSFWGASRVRPVSAWRPTQAATRGLTVGLGVGLITAWGASATAVTIGTLFALISDGLRGASGLLRELPELALGLVLPAPLTLFPSLVGGAFGGAAVAVLKHRMLRHGTAA